MKADSNRDVIQCKNTRCRVRWRKYYFRRKSVSSGTVRLARGIGKDAGQLDFNGGTCFNQADGYVQGSLSSCSATSRNCSSGKVTSRKIAAIAPAVILAKSSACGTTNIPHKSIVAGLTVSSPV